MDNITHTLIGIGLARAGLAQRFGRGTTMILAVASNLPDLDAVCLPFGPLGFLWRRSVTHCLIGAPLLGLAGTLMFKRCYPQLSWKCVFGLTLLGIGGHVFADLWNSYGVVVYWPFRWRRVDLDWVFILDVFVWAILGGSLIVARLARRYAKWVWRVGLGLMAAYVGLCIFASRESEKLLTDQLGNERAASSQLFIYPEPFGPTRFRGVARLEREYAVYEVFPLEKRLELLERQEIEQPNAIVAAARRSEAGKRLDAFLSTAVWRLAPDGETAIVYGLGFRTRLFRPRTPFTFRVAPDGRLWRAQLPYSWSGFRD